MGKALLRFKAVPEIVSVEGPRGRGGAGRGGAGCGKARRQPWWLAYGEKGCASGKGLSSARPPLNFSALARVQAKMFVFAFLTSLTRKN